jgi:PTS system nitrogen regulatory IIA component
MEADLLRIAAWLQPQEILLNIDARNQTQVLETLAMSIGRKHGLESAPIARALWRREQAGSTALGDGFAIPHAQIEGLERPLTLFMRTVTGIDFKAPDGKPVADFLAIMVPHDGARQNHLQLLSMVAQLFSNGEFRRQLDSAPDSVSAAGLFRAGIAKVAAKAESSTTSSARESPL